MLDHPDDGPMFPWTMSEAFERMENQDGLQTDGETRQAEIIHEYMEKASPEERYRLFHLIDLDAEEYKEHIAECVEDIIHSAREQILAIAQGEAELPRMDSVEHRGINQRMLQRRLLDFQLIQHLDGRSELRSAIINLEQHDAAERIIREVLQEHRAELESLEERIAGSIMERLQAHISAG